MTTESDAIRHRLMQSSVPSAYWRKCLLDYGRVGTALRQMVQTGVTSNGLFLHGGSFLAITQVLCKELVLAGGKCRIHDLSEIVADYSDGLRRGYLSEAISSGGGGYFCVPRLFDHSLDRPFPADVGFGIEEALLYALNNGVFLILGSTAPPGECTWWSETFISVVSSNTEIIDCGRA